MKTEPNVIHPSRLQIPKTRILPGSDVSSTLPKYPLKPEHLMEPILVSDRLSSALSLASLRPFFIEIWTTSVSDSPAHISQTQIWPDSDVIKSYLPDAPRLPKTWWKRPQLVMAFATNYRLRYYELFSLKCMRRCENDRMSLVNLQSQLHRISI